MTAVLQYGKWPTCSVAGIPEHTEAVHLEVGYYQLGNYWASPVGRLCKY